ncbi:cation diffusion facilitator family transporter [Allonocardiopsis opalescens]|uniref:Cobalt-zinc-cadmium efflux system protein n=1 Tax=Allonocardiopsis opalescens TaxID=1144618 RepID=A0A2T0Q0A7_9ACTN|nr:cation diffusion facilitator family transporter [Allonocardiopsis opalescens]PRX97227.1 cobalt-zinc-cadmium efflux system protein [Allonocardiopsis opalescens]
MGAGHGHGHATAASAHRGRLVTVLVLTVSVMAVEIVGAVLSGSLALLADGAHMGADAGGLLLALVAVWIAGRPATAKRTYGYQRAEILAAALNALVLFALAAYILYQGVLRLAEPHEVSSGLMLAIAVIGLLANAAGLLLLYRGQRDSLNLRGAYLEVLSDALGSLAAITAAVIIWFTGWTRADAIVSMAIALFIVPRAWGLLREALDVLLEAVPKGVDITDVRARLLAQPGVIDVHDLHAWTITSGVPVLSAHVVVDDDRLGHCTHMLDRLRDCLATDFDVEHSTLQLEPADHSRHESEQHP